MTFDTDQADSDEQPTNTTSFVERIHDKLTTMVGRDDVFVTPTEDSHAEAVAVVGKRIGLDVFEDNAVVDVNVYRHSRRTAEFPDDPNTVHDLEACAEEEAWLGPDQFDDDPTYISAAHHVEEVFTCPRCGRRWEYSQPEFNTPEPKDKTMKELQDL